MLSTNPAFAATQGGAQPMTRPEQYADSAAVHYAEAQRLAGHRGVWLRTQADRVPWVLARAQVAASLAVADELRALHAALGGGHHG